MTEPHVLSDDDADLWISTRHKFADLARLVDPDVTPEQADHLLWDCTPFPLVEGVHDIADALADAAARDFELDEES